MVRFNRFNSKLQKISSPIDIPDVATISTKEMKLIAYIVHIGQTLDSEGTDYSHYIVCLNSGSPDNSWIEIDDAKVRVLKNNEELNKR